MSTQLTTDQFFTQVNNFYAFNERIKHVLKKYYELSPILNHGKHYITDYNDFIIILDIKPIDETNLAINLEVFRSSDSCYDIYGNYCDENHAKHHNLTVVLPLAWFLSDTDDLILEAVANEKAVIKAEQDKLKEKEKLEQKERRKANLILKKEKDLKELARLKKKYPNF